MNGTGAFLATRTGALVSLPVVTAAGFALATVRPPMLGGVLAMAVTIVLMGAIAWLKGTRLLEYGLQRPASWPATLGWGLFYGLVAFVMFRLLLEPAFEHWTGIARDLSRFDYVQGDAGALIALLVQIWIMAAFFEELYFRAFLIGGIAGVFGGTTAGWTAGVVGSCLLFALVHGYQGPAGMLLTASGALFLSAVYLGHDRNLWIPIIAHGLHDSSALVFTYLGIYDRVVHLVF